MGEAAHKGEWSLRAQCVLGWQESQGGGCHQENECSSAEVFRDRLCLREMLNSSPGLEQSDCKGAVAVHAGERCSVLWVRLRGMDGGQGPVPGDAAEAGMTGLNGHRASTRGGVEGVPEIE